MRTRLRHLSRAAGLAVALAAVGNVAAAVCREPASPPGSKVQMVSPDTQMNGVQMSIRSIESTQPVESVIAHYRSLWAGLATASRPGSREQVHEGWRIISTLDGNCFTTVQVRAQGQGSYALVSTSQKGDAGSRATASLAALPTLQGSTVVSDMGYVDGARNARTVVVTNESRLNANVDFYASTLGRQGWVQLMSRPMENAKGTSHVMSFKRGLQEINLVLSPSGNGQVTIVANITDKP